MAVIIREGRRITEREPIVLSKEATARLRELDKNPPEPTEGLVQLLANRRRFTEENPNDRW